MRLLDKTLKGFSWTLAENVVNKILQFVFGILMARLLTPSVFGIVGLAMVFVNILNPLMEGGLSNAIIQREKLSKLHVSSALSFNLLISLILYLAIYFLAPFLEVFFKTDGLSRVFRILGLVIILNAIGSAQMAFLVRKMDFRYISKISIFSNVLSGVIGVYCAYTGLGVWALVTKSIIHSVIVNFLVFVKVKVRFKTSFYHLNSMLGFGTTMMLSSLSNAIFGQTFHVLLSKFYSPIQLGYYSRAELLSSSFPIMISSTIDKITFPVLSKIQNNNLKIKDALSKILELAFLASSFFSIFFIFHATEIINLVLGKDWLQSAEFVKIISIVFGLHPIHSINLSILKVKGQGKAYLKLEVLKKVLLVILLIIAVSYSIKLLIWSLVFHSIISLFISAYYSNRLIEFGVLKQFKILLKPFAFSLLSIYGSIQFTSQFNFSNSLFVISNFAISSSIIMIFVTFFPLKSTLLIKEFLHKR